MKRQECKSVIFLLLICSVNQIIIAVGKPLPTEDTSDKPTESVLFKSFSAQPARSLMKSEEPAKQETYIEGFQSEKPSVIVGKSEMKSKIPKVIVGTTGIKSEKPSEIIGTADGFRRLRIGDFVPKIEKGAALKNPEKPEMIVGTGFGFGDLVQQLKQGRALPDLSESPRIKNKIMWNTILKQLNNFSSSFDSKHHTGTRLKRQEPSETDLLGILGEDQGGETILGRFSDFMSSLETTEMPTTDSQ